MESDDSDWDTAFTYIYNIHTVCNFTARRLVLPGDLQGRSRHVDHDDDESNWGGRIKPLLKFFNECKSLTGLGELNPY